MSQTAVFSQRPKTCYFITPSFPSILVAHDYPKWIQDIQSRAFHASPVLQRPSHIIEHRILESQPGSPLWQYHCPMELIDDEIYLGAPIDHLKELVLLSKTVFQDSNLNLASLLQNKVNRHGIFVLPEVVYDDPHGNVWGGNQVSVGCHDGHWYWGGSTRTMRLPCSIRGISHPSKEAAVIAAIDRLGEQIKRESVVDSVSKRGNQRFKEWTLTRNQLSLF